MLISKREELTLSQRKMAAFTGVPLHIYCNLESLKAHPNDSESLMKHAATIAQVLEMDIDELFPESLTGITVNKKVMEINSADMQLSLNPGHNQTKQKQLRIKSAVESAIKQLTPREETVVRRRFFENETLEEVAKEISRDSYYPVTRERVRQIEAKALRKLRHPNRARPLKEAQND